MSAASATRIDVIGLKELRRDLRRLADDGHWRPRLRETNLRAAGIIASDARSRALSRSSPRMGSVASGTIRPLAAQTKAYVAVGLASVPWTMGHEFGSARYLQFPAVRKGGYNVFPAVAERTDDVIDVYGRLLDDVAREAFPG
jgi:hypothetical protein